MSTSDPELAGVEFAAEALVLAILEDLEREMLGAPGAGRQCAQKLYDLGHHPDELVRAAAMGRLVRIVKALIIDLDRRGWPRERVFKAARFYLSGPADLPRPPR